jgi:hypothetical protein
MYCNKTNKWLNDGVFILLQINLIYVFLTVFFFLYVTSVEKTSFKNQMNLIVDDIMNDLNDDLDTMIKSNDKTKKLSPEDLNIIINGFIDTVEEKTKIDTRKGVSSIENQNSVVISSSYKMLGIVSTIVFILIAGILLLSFCLPIVGIVKDSFIAVFFVALTEFLVITLIVSNYISASPTLVKKEFAQEIKSWIKDNKNIN